MSRGLQYDPCDTELNYILPSKNVDEAPSGLGKLAAAALQSLEASVALPSKKTHDDVLRANIGWAMDPVGWAKRQAASAELERQTAHIADALAGAGVNVVLDGDVTFIGAVTGVVEQQRVYRACRFLPTVAARDRRPTVNGLKLFISGHKHSKYFRYAVMTCSEPVPFSAYLQGDMRGAIQELNRRISKWAHTAQKKKWGVEVLYRGIEFTRATAAERDAEAHARGQASNLSERYGADTVLYHVHANVLYWPTRALPGDAWKAFLRFTHEATGAWWKDNGKVGNVEELVKYCSKPNDTLKSSADELVWLYHATQRLKLCQPLGDFKDWMKALEVAGEKVVRVHVGRGDGRLMRVKKRKKSDKDSDDEKEKKKKEKKDGEDGDESDAATDTEKKAPPSNMLLGMTLPQWRHTPWAEPLIMVQRYDPSKPFGEAGGDIEAWKRAAREMWDDNFGPEPEEALRVAQMARDAALSADDIREAAEAAEAYIVHTCRPTVPTGGNADEEVPPEELDDDLREVVSLFDGATVVRLAPRTTDEDNEIPFEAPDVVAWREKLRADLATSEARWAEWRASAAQVPGRSSELDCRAAA